MYLLVRHNRNVPGFQSHRDVGVKIVPRQVRGRGDTQSRRSSRKSKSRSCSLILIFAAFYTRGSSSKGHRGLLVRDKNISVESNRATYIAIKNHVPHRYQ